ncbi:RPL6 [Scenedesmus sp. PABB004]|nr:RPL6 [Scenedesmus sp. PABB004]
MGKATEIARGVFKEGRSRKYHTKGLWALKKKNGGKFPVTAKKAPAAAPAATKAPRFYPADDVPKPLAHNAVRKPTKLRPSITPGTVLILLAGRFKGKRVVFLRQQESGLLLVTGPFKLNGVPVRRVNQAYVIATSTKVALPKLSLDKFTDSYFKAAEDKQKKKKGEEEFFKTEEAKQALSAEYIANQKEVDAALLKALSPELKGYLSTRFSLKSGDRPHLMKASDRSVAAARPLPPAVAMASIWFKAAGLCGASGVGLAAYGAHGFKPADAHFAEVYRRANQQQMYHAALLAVAPLTRRPHLTGGLALAGVLLFSGSCYAAALTQNRTYGKLAPFGGIALIAAWASLLLRSATQSLASTPRAHAPDAITRAATPATAGAAIDVPESTTGAVLVSLRWESDGTSFPGAKSATHVPKFEKAARASVRVVAPTASAPRAPAGEVPHASAPSLPAAATTTAPAREQGARGGFSLSLRRLVLEGAALAPPPAPWPLGMFDALGGNLSMSDVRLVVGAADLATYADWFQGNVDPVHFHTDDASFLQIAGWQDGRTQLHSVTLVSGACAPGGGRGGAAAALAVAAPGSPPPPAGCNVRTVDNATLVPTLLRAAGVATPEPLLMLITSNATLGPGLGPGAVPVARPVVLAGLYSVPTSVDLGMVVNQLNVTAPHSKVFWQSLLLENAGPGDATSSVMAPPYSAAVSANIYAVYCNRTSNCLNLYNTTTVLASQDEMDYVTFMYSMFNSPLPNMQSHADFYHTELRVTVIDVRRRRRAAAAPLAWAPPPRSPARRRRRAAAAPLARAPPRRSRTRRRRRRDGRRRAGRRCAPQMGPGPNGYGMTLHNMSTSAWVIVDGVFTTQPAVSVAPRLPFPAGRPVIRTATQAAPWVQAVDSCASMQSAMVVPSEENRLHVWMLTANVSLVPPSDPACWQRRKLERTTQIYGAVGTRSADAPGGSAADVGSYALSWGFLPGALELPAGAQDKFLQIQNVSLAQLPQGPGAAAAAGLRAAAPGGGGGPAPPDVWTLLMWSVNRTMTGSALFVADADIRLPAPELGVLAAAARGASSFVVQLAGSVGLAFTAARLEGGGVRVGALQGPGMTGSNLLLLPDGGAAAAMPGGYAWIDDVSAAPTSSRLEPPGPRGGAARVAAVVGTVVGGAALLTAAVLGCWWWARRRRRRRAAREQQQLITALKRGSDCTSVKGSEPSGMLSSSSGGAGGEPLAGFVAVDVDRLADAGGGGSDCRATPRGGKPSPRGGGPAPAACGDGTAGSAARSQAGSLGSGLGGGSRSADSDPGDNTVASGLARWKTAISATTMQLMERRMASAGQTMAMAGSASSAGSGSRRSPQAAALAAAAGGAAAREPSGGGRGGPPAAGGAPANSLQLQGLLGQGSFGAVYLATWHGKRVAVKVMQLPATALLVPAAAADDGADAPDDGLGAEAAATRRRRARQLEQNSPPHMAIMETVVSSTMSHPNVVQVYTYMLNPLTTDAAAGGSAGGARGQQQQAAALGQAAAPAAAAGVSSVSGWELKLVMELCDQGTLRDALDRKLLLRGSGAAMLQPALVLSLAHDVAAALLHLHSEGVVHGDLKAGNVMLTKGGDDPGGVWAATVGYRVTAKVADFGLALPLGPADTHATMAARGTPTHMSPELFMAGHVSKASDVYAYGVLLYEIMTGQRAYAGVPIPLLPHEVARQGLRPTWPPGMPSGCRDLRRLAEACWAQQPQDRPPLQVIFNFLEACQDGRAPPELAACADGQQQQQQQQPQAAPPGVTTPPAAAPGGAGAARGEGQGGLSWSEVTYGSLKKLASSEQPPQPPPP